MNTFASGHRMSGRRPGSRRWDPVVQRVMDKRWEGQGSPAPDNVLGAKVYRDFAITADAVIFFIGRGM
jgi:hypothetical protein